MGQLRGALGHIWGGLDRAQGAKDSSCGNPSPI